MQSFKFTKLILSMALISGGANSAFAGSATGGRITQLTPTRSGYTFITNGTRAGTPSCATGAPNNWAIDVSTPSGQAIAASIITAFSTGKSVDVQGTNSCPTFQPSVEEVSFLSVGA